MGKLLMKRLLLHCTENRLGLSPRIAFLLPHSVSVDFPFDDIFPARSFPVDFLFFFCFLSHDRSLLSSLRLLLRPSVSAGYVPRIGSTLDHVRLLRRKISRLSGRKTIFSHFGIQETSLGRRRGLLTSKNTSKKSAVLDTPGRSWRAPGGDRVRLGASLTTSRSSPASESTQIEWTGLREAPRARRDRSPPKDVRTTPC